MMLFKIGLYEYGETEDDIFHVFEKDFEDEADCDLEIAENNFYACVDYSPLMVRLN